MARGTLQRGPLKSLIYVGVCACMCALVWISLRFPKRTPAFARYSMCTPVTVPTTHARRLCPGEWKKRCGKYCVLHFFSSLPVETFLPGLSNESLTTPTEPLSQEIYILPLKYALKDTRPRLQWVWKFKTALTQNPRKDVSET